LANSILDEQGEADIHRISGVQSKAGHASAAGQRSRRYDGPTPWVRCKGDRGVLSKVCLAREPLDPSGNGTGGQHRPNCSLCHGKVESSHSEQSRKFRFGEAVRTTHDKLELPRQGRA
jgi:hypothetical protein